MLAYAVNDRLSLGLDGRLVQLWLGSSKAADTGALLGDMLGKDADFPVGDPLWEGSQSFEADMVQAVSGGLGARWTWADGGGVQIAGRAPTMAQVPGNVALEPSQYLDVQLTSTVTTELNMPASVFLSGALPLGKATLDLELMWIGWSILAESEIQVDDIDVGSSDPTFQALLEGYGLDEATFLDNVSKATAVTAMHDTWNPGASVWLPVGEAVLLRTGIWLAPAAVPSTHVHPGNLDFTTVDLRAAAAWTPQPWLTLGLGLDGFVVPDRQIDDSLYRLQDKDSAGVALPSANGTYELALARAGLTLLVRLGAED